MGRMEARNPLLRTRRQALLYTARIKSAYRYAREGGYTGSEAAFATRQAQLAAAEPITVSGEDESGVLHTWTFFGAVEDTATE